MSWSRIPWFKHITYLHPSEMLPVIPLQRPPSFYIYRNRVESVLEEAFELAMTICNEELDEFGVSEIFDIIDQTLPTGFILNSGLWPLYQSPDGRSLCVCGRFGIFCKHGMGENHWINLSNFPITNHGTRFRPKLNGKVKVIEFERNVFCPDNHPIQYDIQLVFALDAGGGGSVYRATINSKYNVVSQYYTNTTSIVFDPHPVRHEVYNSYVSQFVSRLPTSRSSPFYSAINAHAPEFTLALSFVNVTRLPTNCLLAVKTFPKLAAERRKERHTDKEVQTDLLSNTNDIYQSKIPKDCWKFSESDINLPMFRDPSSVTIARTTIPLENSGISVDAFATQIRTPSQPPPGLAVENYLSDAIKQSAVENRDDNAFSFHKFCETNQQYTFMNSGNPFQQCTDQGVNIPNIMEQTFQQNIPKETGYPASSVPPPPPPAIQQHFQQRRNYTSVAHYKPIRPPLSKDNFPQLREPRSFSRGKCMEQEPPSLQEPTCSQWVRSPTTSNSNPPPSKRLPSYSEASRGITNGTRSNRIPTREFVNQSYLQGAQNQHSITYSNIRPPSRNGSLSPMNYSMTVLGRGRGKGKTPKRKSRPKFSISSRKSRRSNKRKDDSSEERDYTRSESPHESFMVENCLKTYSRKQDVRLSLEDEFNIIEQVIEEDILSEFSEKGEQVPDNFNWSHYVEKYQFAYRGYEKSDNQ